MVDFQLMPHIPAYYVVEGDDVVLGIVEQYAGDWVFTKLTASITLTQEEQDEISLFVSEL